MTKPTNLNGHHKALTSLDYVEGVDEYLEMVFGGGEKAAASEPGSRLSTSKRPTAFLAALLREALRANDWTKSELAARLDVPLNIVDILLMGVLPPHKLDLDLLEKIAYLTGYEVSTIGAIVGCDISSDRQMLAERREREVRNYLQAISNVLFETLDARYHHDAPTGGDHDKQYDLIIRKLEEIIAKMRRDLKFVEGVKAMLKNPDAALILPPDADKPASKPTILHLREHLERIVKQLEDSREVKEA